jgi:hypothetical protein
LFLFILSFYYEFPLAYWLVSCAIPESNSSRIGLRSERRIEEQFLPEVSFPPDLPKQYDIPTFPLTEIPLPPLLAMDETEVDESFLCTMSHSKNLAELWSAKLQAASKLAFLSCQLDYSKSPGTSLF